MGFQKLAERFDFMLTVMEFIEENDRAWANGFPQCLEHIPGGRIQVSVQVEQKTLMRGQHKIGQRFMKPALVKENAGIVELRQPPFDSKRPLGKSVPGFRKAFKAVEPVQCRQGVAQQVTPRAQRCSLPDTKFEVQHGLLLDLLCKRAIQVRAVAQARGVAKAVAVLLHPLSHFKEVDGMVQFDTVIAVQMRSHAEAESCQPRRDDFLKVKLLALGFLSLLLWSFRVLGAGRELLSL